MHLTPVWLNSPFPIITQKLSKISSNTERRKLCSVRDSSWITTVVNVRGEGTVVAGRAYLLRCTSFYDCIPNTTEKRRRVFPFPNNHRRPSEILTTLLFTFFSTFSVRPSKIFLFLQRLSSLFFYFDYMALHSLVSLLPDRSRKPPFFVWESDNSTLRYECDETFSDEFEFAARAEGEWCNHTCQENVFRTSIVRNFISRGVK